MNTNSESPYWVNARITLIVPLEVSPHASRDEMETVAVDTYFDVVNESRQDIVGTITVEVVEDGEPLPRLAR